MDIGSAARPMPGETVCGDQHLIIRGGDTLLVAVADGLGHGPQAAIAAQSACEAVQEHSSLGLVELMRTCDQRLRGTRGAALTLLRFELTEHRLRHVGIGNVEVIVHGLHTVRPISAPGIVGGNVRRLLEQQYPLTAGDWVVCFTDGISTRCVLDPYRGRKAASVASAILAEWASPNDDATCVVVGPYP